MLAPAREAVIADDPGPARRSGERRDQSGGIGDQMTNQELSALEEIRTLKARYFRYMDQQRWDEWQGLFTDDVHADFSQDGGVHDGAAAFRSHVEAALEGAISIHHGHMAELEITGPDAARGVWSMEDHIEFPDGAPRRRLWGTGWYTEQYRRGEDGSWRIAELVLRRLRVEVDGRRTIP